MILIFSLEINNKESENIEQMLKNLISLEHFSIKSHINYNYILQGLQNPQYLKSLDLQGIE